MENMMINKTWTATVVEEDGELLLVFNKEMLDELGWKEGDTIVWDMGEDSNIVIAKKDTTPDN